MTKFKNILKKGFLFFLVMYAVYLIYAMLVLGGGCNRMEPEIHYIPKGYIGSVYIFFGEPNGKRKEYQNGSRVYRIPKSGILKTRFKNNIGWINSNEKLKFYYYDKGTTYSIPKRISSRDFECNNDSIKIVIGEYGPGRSSNIFLKGDKTVLGYRVDSLKNIPKKPDTYTKEMYENWDK